MKPEAVDYHQAASQVVTEFHLNDLQAGLLRAYVLGEMTLTNQLLGGGHGDRNVILNALDRLEENMKKAEIPDQALSRVINLLYP